MARQIPSGSPPAAESARELRRRSCCDALGKFLAVSRPGRRLGRELAVDAAQDAAHGLRRTGRQLRIGKDVCNVLLHRQRRIGQFENARDFVGQLFPGFGEPDRMQMRLHEVAIGKIERRRAHDPADHRFRPADMGVSCFRPASGNGKLLRLQQSCDGLDLVAGVFRQASADRTAEIE
jgi:hypothetical protein